MIQLNTSEILVNVRRGELTESVHHGHIAVVNDQGTLLNFSGNPKHLTFARSTAKLLQAIPLVEAGAAEQFNLTSEEIALCCASHNGEAAHVHTVESLLTKINKKDCDLHCGPHEPYHRPTAKAMRLNNIKPSTLHNNCSGKHAGMLTVAASIGTSDAYYYKIDHPVQQMLLQTFADMCETDAASIHLGIDGCGVPVYGLSIDRLAHAFAKMGTGASMTKARSKACQTLVQSLIKHPYYLAGSERFDTLLVEVTGGRIIGKMGAEGIFCGMIPQLKLGFTVKIGDGSERALYPAVMELLLQLQQITDQEYEKLKHFHQPDVKNWRKDVIGSITPIFKLHEVIQ
jgi:L-asparaginase II